MSSVETSKIVFEVAKFAVYVTLPVGVIYLFANNPKTIRKIIRKHQYIVYPPEGPRPPSPEELKEMAREMARKRNNGL